MNKYSDYLIVSDLDGTLINSKQVISQKNLSAINEFTSEGGRFAIATGRTIQTVRPFIKDLKLNGPCILYNGAAIYDFHNEKLMAAEYLEKELLVDYINFSMTTFNQAVVEIFTPEGMFIISREENVDEYVLREKQQFKRTDLNEVLGHEWLKLMLYDKHHTLIEAQKAFQGLTLESNFDNVFSHEYYFEILKKGISKGSALQVMRQMEHFKDKKIIAVGDYDNDIEMVRNADVGIAVENAREGVKKAADRITVSNDADAIYDIVYNVIPTL